jgi:hypothetical protein
MEKNKENEVVVEQPKTDVSNEENKQVSVEQVAQRLQILSFEIKQKQTEYNQLHDAWLKAMTTKPEDGKKE